MATTSWQDYVDRTCPKAPLKSNGWGTTHPVQNPQEVKPGVFILKCRHVNPRKPTKVVTSTVNLWASYKGSNWPGYSTADEANADAWVREWPAISPATNE